MPKYRFKAIDINNKKIKGTFIANDDDDLKEIIKSQDYYLVSFKKLPESSQLFTFLEKINTADFTMFCRQFAIMLNAGLNIDKTVSVLYNTTKNAKLKSILEVVYNDLLKGKMLSEAFAKYPKTFPVFFRNMIEIGERSGRLDIIFNRLADYYEKDAKTKAKVKSALAYPCFLIILTFGALMVISMFVMPQFSKMFESFGARLPEISRIVMDVTTFIKDNVLNIIALIIGLILIFMLLNRIKSVRKVFDKVKLNMPLTKGLTIASITSRFANGFSVLLNSGLPLLDSMGIISRLLGNLEVEEQLIVVKNQISVGKSISKSLETINIFPDMLIQMVSVGETTGKLEEVLDKVNNFFEGELDSEIKKLTAAIEPIMIIIIGAIVVVVLLSIFLPMLDLMSAIETQG